MRYNPFILLLTLLLVGCSQPEPEPAPPAPPPPQVEPDDPPLAPQPLPSSEYLRGYWDGYNGNWIQLGSWTFNSQYRHGWSQGSKDREAGVQPRYPILSS